MSAKCMRKSMVNAAKEKLNLHKSLGQRSTLSIVQVASLLDIVTGKSLPSTGAAVYSEEAFSLN